MYSGTGEKKLEDSPPSKQWGTVRSAVAPAAIACTQHSSLFSTRSNEKGKTATTHVDG
jgi:hypothetical protein